MESKSGTKDSSENCISPHGILTSQRKSSTTLSLDTPFLSLIIAAEGIITDLKVFALFDWRYVVHDVVTPH